ncbi:shikimate dehydrogenase [Pararhizobium mangrovi]|uniref:Shikimate dehydrogenase (NADP(+)) n=1 Tax=Pararhizobium mangrovi TaxID=2590452 RepID=A0A506TYT7_9HYPH|nr:shikimate dehydrogenase [Pararhizobium mangrovi]TPW27263.1 shikimate dehydrogenase [Pararhizobium mangrovi]
MDERPRKAFVLGHPIAHSRSPTIHRHWLHTYAIDGGYEPIDMPEPDLAAFIETLRNPGSQWLGGNVTIPHKEAVAALVDEPDDLVRALGAANTIWRRNGRLHATNTDVHGFLANLDKRRADWCRPERPAVVLGAGGAARAVLRGLLDRGYRDIRLVNRTVARAEALAERFGAAHVTPFALSELGSSMHEAALFVNASSLGLGGSPVPSLDFATLALDAIVTDIVYTPLETPILAMAKRAGLVTVDGLGMLLHQAVPAFEKWFGRRPEVTPELRETVLSDIGGQA